MPPPSHLKKTLISVIAVALILVHVKLPAFRGDSFEIAMVILGVLPWLQGVFKTIEVAGVGKVELQELKEKVDGAVESLEQTTEAASGVLFPERDKYFLVAGYTPVGKLLELSKDYVEIRKRLKAGTERTSEMSNIFGKMVAVCSEIKDLPVDDYISSPDQGRRLAGYAYLYAKPDPRMLDSLVTTLTSGIENKPFGQYWAIRAIGRISENLSSDQISEDTIERLKRFLKTLRRGTDRYFELSKIGRQFGFGQVESLN